MATAGVEVALGIVDDVQFGSLIMVAAGGQLVEVMGDRALAVPPLDSARASTLMEGLAVARLFSGVRGAAPVDRAALVAALLSLSTLAIDLGDLIAGLDVNPVIVSEHGAVAVDALVIPKGSL
jgi:acyl-CoA synthetase (NDP forming)